MLLLGTEGSSRLLEVQRHALRGEALEHTARRSDLELAGRHAYAQADAGEAVGTVGGDGRFARQQEVAERRVRDRLVGAYVVGRLEPELSYPRGEGLVQPSVVGEHR